MAAASDVVGAVWQVAWPGLFLFSLKAKGILVSLFSFQLCSQSEQLGLSCCCFSLQPSYVQVLFLGSSLLPHEQLLFLLLATSSVAGATRRLFCRVISLNGYLCVRGGPHLIQKGFWIEIKVAVFRSNRDLYWLLPGYNIKSVP